MKSIEECLAEAERALSDNRLKGHNPLWSPRLIEAVREAVDALRSEGRKHTLEGIRMILNGEAK